MEKHPLRALGPYPSALWPALMASGIWAALNEQWVWGVAMALPLCLRPFWSARPTVTLKQFESLCDFSFVAIIIGYILIVTEIEPRREASRAFLLWLPLFLYPLALCHFIAKLPPYQLSNIVVLMRSKRLGIERWGQRTIDLGWVFVFILVLSSCAAPVERHGWVYPTLATFCTILFFSQSTQGRSPWLRGLLLAVALWLGFSLQLGIQQAEKWIQQNANQWWTSTTLSPGLAKKSTLLGQTAQLQNSWAIHLRIESPKEALTTPLYLRAASYHYWGGRDMWMNSGEVVSVGRSPEGYFPLTPEKSQRLPQQDFEMALWCHLQNQGWLPLPEDGVAILAPSLTRLEVVNEASYRAKSNHGTVLVNIDREGSDAKRNRNVAVNQKASIPSPPTEAQEESLSTHSATGQENLFSTHAAVDARPLKNPSPNLEVTHAMYLGLPEQDRAIIRQFLDRVGLSEHPSPRHLSRQLIRHFSAFEYTLDLDAPPQGKTPLEFFLLDRRAGHCEYFATATALILRAYGIPTRYCTGYVVTEKMDEHWVARGRDAHAWVEYWDGGTWNKMDTTPSAHLAKPLLQPLFDLWEPLSFWFDRWRFASGEDQLFRLAPWGLVVVLLWFGYRLAREWRQHRQKRTNQRRPSSLHDDPGFGPIEDVLARHGYGRQAWESWASWASRLEQKGVILPQTFVEAWRTWAYDPNRKAPPQTLEEELRLWRLEWKNSKGQHGQH